jgi:hypothetical protein
MPNTDASSGALRALADLLHDIDADADHERWRFVDDLDRAMYREFAMHSLHHALQF